MARGRKVIGRNVLPVVTAVLICSALLGFAGPVLGRLEGFVLPVATSPTITRIDPVGGGVLGLWGVMTKLRDCDMRGLDFWDAGGSVVGFQNTSQAKREVGTFDFGPWFLHVEPDRLGQVRGELLHECHDLLPWRTRTRLRLVMP